MEVPLPPADSVTLGPLSEMAGPEGEIEAPRLMVPEKPAMLVTVSVDVAEEPAVIVILIGFADITKSGVVLVENTADSTDSGTAWVVPLAIVTQTGGSLVGALEEPQPVWKPRLVLELVPVTL